MARKKKTGVELDPAEKARQKKLRAAQRREDRKLRKSSTSGSSGSSKRSAAPDYSGEFIRDEFLWLRRIDAVRFAEKIMANNRQRPYWLSITHSKTDGNPPTAHFYPCTYFRTEDRVYYGFLFREHRDMFYDVVADRARKEFTEVVYRLQRSASKI